jgi:hypothetical protein
MTESMSIDEVHEWLEQMSNDSIYDGKRLAQPDEVANFKAGDGIEKAFLLVNVIRNRNISDDIEIVSGGREVIVDASEKYKFASAKGLDFRIVIGREGTDAVTERRDFCRKK